MEPDRIVAALLEDEGEQFDPREYLLGRPPVGRVRRDKDRRGQLYYEDTGTGSVITVDYYNGRPNFNLIYDESADTEGLRRASGIALVTAAIKGEIEDYGTFHKETTIRVAQNWTDRMAESEPGSIQDILDILERQGKLKIVGYSGAVIQVRWGRGDLPESDDFDAREYMLAGRVENALARLGYEDTGWCWYYERIPFNVYIDPMANHDYVEIEASWYNVHDQHRLFEGSCNKESAVVVAAEFVKLLNRDWGVVANKSWMSQRNPLMRVESALQSTFDTHAEPGVLPQNEAFSARNYFLTTKPVGVNLAREMGFDDETGLLKRVIGQFEVYINELERKKGEAERYTVSVYRNYGWQDELVKMYFVEGDADLARVLEAVLPILQDHTTELGYATGDKQAAEKLAAIPEKA